MYVFVFVLVFVFDSELVFVEKIVVLVTACASGYHDCLVHHTGVSLLHTKYNRDVRRQKGNVCALVLQVYVFTCHVKLPSCSVFVFVFVLVFVLIFVFVLVFVFLRTS